MTHKGRPKKETLERFRALVAEGKSVDEIAADLNARPRAVRRWMAREQKGQHAIPSPALAESAPAVESGSTAPLENPQAVAAELFGAPPPPKADPNAPPAPEVDPLDAAGEELLTPTEVVAACDFVVGSTDSLLFAAFGGPPPQGMSDGQRALVKAFSKRLARAVNELLGGPSKMTAGETVALAFGILIVPRAAQRVAGYVKRRRAGGSVRGRPEDGKDVRGDPVGSGAGEGA